MREVYDLLLDTEAVVVGEVIVPVRLCLAALPGERLVSIERVYSHIQALTQAEPFLRSRDWALLAATNTAGAGRTIRERGERGCGRGALADGRRALHGLEVLADDIQAERRNRTRFLVLALPDTTALPGRPRPSPTAACAAPWPSRCATSRARWCAPSASSLTTAST